MALTHHWYVAVLSKNNKFYFLTEVNGKVTNWKRGKLPKEFGYEQATRIADGLCRSGYQAVVIQSAGVASK